MIEILFVFLLVSFTFCSCLKLELKLVNNKHKKKNYREELITSLRKRKSELRKKIGILNRAIRKDIYADSQRREEVLTLKKKFKKELSKITAEEQLLINQRLKEDIDRFIKQRANSFQPKPEN